MKKSCITADRSPTRTYSNGEKELVLDEKILYIIIYHRDHF
jgi:hypothetical protein